MKLSKRIIGLSGLLVALLFISSLPAMAQSPGDLDTSFDTDGKVTTDFGGSSADSGESVAVQTDGKIVVVGESGGDFAVARYNTNGSLDANFGTGGKVIVGGADKAYGVALQSDGKIVVAGTDGADFVVARFNTNGSPDTNFGTNGIVKTDIGGTDFDIAYGVVIQTDGKIVVAGSAFIGGDSDFAVVRYNTNGIPDNNFDGNGIATMDIDGNGNDDDGRAVAIQTDGKIVVAGESGGNFAVARFNANGTDDTTFNGDADVTTDFGGFDRAYGVAVQTDGKIVVVGEGGGNFALARYNTNGSPDTNFGTGGKVTTDFGGADRGSGVAVQTDGQIVVAGLGGNNIDFALARYNTNGALDNSFSGDGKVITDFGGTGDNGNGLVIDKDGKIVVAGVTNAAGNFDFAVARYIGAQAANNKVYLPIVFKSHVSQGNQWVKQTSNTTQQLNGVDCPTTSTCYAVGDGGTILATTNGGNTWSSKPSGTTQKLYNVSCSSASNCVTVGDGGTILTTSNGGTSWTARASGTGETLRGISCPSGSNSCLAAGGNSVNTLIAGSNDGGASWLLLDVGNSALYDASCPNAGTCTVAGQFGRVFGIILSIPPAIPDGLKHTLGGELRGLDCPSDTNCYTVGESGKIYATTNGGGAWLEKVSGTMQTLWEVSCPSATTCFAVGNSGTILTTSNGGTSWTGEASPVTTSLMGVDCPGTGTCFAVGSNGTILAK